MSSQIPTNSHCSRTYWTPTMERFFIDLMLEHIHRGNRIGHTFNKKAWTDMLAVFNAKFGSQYDKDVLKSRYTNLWRQFNDIKNLLGQSGFSWDEARQMVIADDYSWDVYIKAHPEARPYKTKAILNFDDLCLIYGYTVADGRYSRSSHDVEVEDEIHGANFVDGNNSLAPSSSRAEWTCDMDQHFIELLLSQKERGNKLDNTFTKQAWTEMLSLFNAKFGSEHSKRVLRHRFKKLWKYYSDIRALVEQNGFFWDDKQQMVVAENDIWDAYLKVRPHVRSYRTKTLPDYIKLGLIFGDMISKESQIHQDKHTKNGSLGTKAGNERSRTYWTPPMDYYFIDLMLEQVRRGNRIGQSFITQAWSDMVASFNSNFRSNHDKEVLKNRYKHFRKLYNDVKALLEHCGFSWDEAREMVTADDHIWDAYIKGHPEARSYRVKTVPSYRKLCVIYGQDKFDSLYVRLTGIDLARESPSLMMGDGKDEDCPTSADRSIDLTTMMERYFIDIILIQVQKGYKINNTLGEQAWANMTASFKEKFGAQYEQHILQNCYLSLMNQYIEVSSLLNQDGFAWDGTRQMIVADDNTWEKYAKEHPHMISYRDKGLGHYSDLCTIFGTSGMVDVHLSCEDLRMDFDQNPPDTRCDGCSGDPPEPAGETEMSTKKRHTSTCMEPNQKVQKTGTQKSSTNLTGLVTNFVNKEAGKNLIPIENAIEALQALPDIDDEVLLDGCDLLEDEKKAKTFLALDASLRKKWLLRKLGRS